MAVTRNKNKKGIKVKIAKALKKQADSIGVNVIRIVDNKLYYTYKDNVVKSYYPRSQRGQEIEEYNKDELNTHIYKRTYHHTGIFERSIGTEIDGNTVSVIISDKETYVNQATSRKTTPTQVYKWLTEGTYGGGFYNYQDKYNKGIAYNYSTPAHLFELHTKLQMQPFYEELKYDIETVYKKNRHVKRPGDRKDVGRVLRKKYRTYGHDNQGNPGKDLLRKRY